MFMLQAEFVCDGGERRVKAASHANPNNDGFDYNSSNSLRDYPLALKHPSPSLKHSQINAEVLERDSCNPLNNFSDSTVQFPPVPNFMGQARHTKITQLPNILGLERILPNCDPTRPDAQETYQNTGGYTCHYCSKSFDRRSNCLRHEMVHTNDRPYQCHLCPKNFITKANLKYHLLRSQEHATLDWFELHSVDTYAIIRLLFCGIYSSICNGLLFYFSDWPFSVPNITTEIS